MPTTIQVNEGTLDVLKHLRKSMNAPSYDEVINRVIEKSMKNSNSMYGALGKKNIKWVMKGLRDKSDRF